MLAKGRIRIVDDNILRKRDDGGLSVTFNERNYKRKLYICPCANEHFESVELLKLRIACDFYDIKIITHGRLNYLPFFSIFADEAIFYDKYLEPPTYYQDHFSDNKANAKILSEDNWRDLIQGVSDEEVVKRFSNWEVWILESAYDTWRFLNLPRNLTVHEFKRGNAFDPILRELNLLGHEHVFQANLLQRTGLDHYMSAQLLSTHLLKWVYVCNGGASNLFTILPARVALLSDHGITPDRISIMRPMFMNRYEREDIPIILSDNCCHAASAGNICMKWDDIARAIDVVRELESPEVVRG